MEINTEINKVFGEEMAKIFASSISEETLKVKAEEMWKQLSNKPNEWGNKQNSDIEKLIKNTLLDKLHEKILKILKEPVNEEMMEAHARELIDRARKVAEEAIVKSMANHLASTALSAWNVQDKFVTDVLTVLHTEEERLKRYF